MRVITLSVEYNKIEFDRMPAKLWGNGGGSWFNRNEYDIRKELLKEAGIEEK